MLGQAPQSKLTSEERTARMDMIREKFDQKEIQGMFDLGWQLLYNYPDRICAIEPIHVGRWSPGLGIADQGMSGFNPTPVYFSHPSRELLIETANWFNKEILGLTEYEALELTARSYR